MSNYPAHIQPTGETHCQAAGCIKNDSGREPALAVPGTDLCRWHHGQFPKVLGDLVHLHKDLTTAAYTRTSAPNDSGVRTSSTDGGGHPADVGSAWNPNAAVVLAELSDWAAYVTRLVIREAPVPEPEIHNFTRTETTYTLEGVPEVRRWVEHHIIEYSHGLTETTDTPTQLAVIARWHALWLSSYPFVGPYLLADALKHRTQGMRALNTGSVRKVTLARATCQEVLGITDEGTFICGAPLFAILRDEDGKVSELLCSHNPRHIQLPRPLWPALIRDVHV